MGSAAPTLRRERDVARRAAWLVAAFCAALLLGVLHRTGELQPHRCHAQSGHVDAPVPGDGHDEAACGACHLLAHALGNSTLPRPPALPGEAVVTRVLSPAVAARPGRGAPRAFLSRGPPLA